MELQSESRCLFVFPLSPELPTERVTMLQSSVMNLESEIQNLSSELENYRQYVLLF